MKQETKKKIVNAVIVIVVIVALFLTANWLVSNINIAELLKQLHGG
jgi:hypothetical protein